MLECKECFEIDLKYRLFIDSKYRFLNIEPTVHCCHVFSKFRIKNPPPNSPSVPLQSKSYPAVSYLLFLFSCFFLFLLFFFNFLLIFIIFFNIVCSMWQQLSLNSHFPTESQLREDVAKFCGSKLFINYFVFIVCSI